MDKATYVKRLKKMLTNKKAPCGYCPCSFHDNSKFTVSGNGCEICQAFNGLKFKESADYKDNCPCHRPGKLGAIDRAWKKIGEYESKYGEV